MFKYGEKDPGRDSTLIPRKIFFGNPDKALVRLSPDGTKISFLSSVDGVLNVWVGSSYDPDAAKPITHDKKRGIHAYFWAYTNRHILYIQDKDGDENWRLYCVDLTNKAIKSLTQFEKVQARIQEVSPFFPQEILVGLNNRVPQLHDIYRIDFVSGNKKMIMKNEDFFGLITDDLYHIRLGIRMKSDGGNEILKLSDKNIWEPFIRIKMEDSLTTSPIGFDKTTQILYMMDSRNRSTAAFYAFDLQTNIRTLLAEDSKADVSGFIVHPTEKNVQAVAFTYERKQWKVLDPAIKDDLDYLETVADGEIMILSRTLDDKYWIIGYLMDNSPYQYYYYEHEEKKARFLFTNNKELENLPLAKMHSITTESFDGLNLVIYYTLPVNSDTDADGIPDHPYPMVLFVHGGPWSRDLWGYNPYHQWLANRGYGVLSVNFRGSTGFGKEFVNAGNKEWGRKMHDDLIDAVDWAIQKGIADPNLISIVGASYGGYATLVGMTFTPKKFICGVDIVGPSNLVTLLKSIPPYWEPQVELFATRVGDHRTEEGRSMLTSHSPLTYSHRIQRPLLIGQGANDPRVKQSESDQIVRALQKKNIPVTYVLYNDEGHGFARPENRLSFSAVMELFLAKHLGGRCEPIKDAFQGSSIAVPIGSEEIPCLVDSLKHKKLD